MREIVLDVETTGLWLQNGHRVIEIACIELEKHQPTGRIFHRYVNPLMARMPTDAFDIHGIPIEFLWRHGPFKSVADSFLSFVRRDQLVIHNAAFDIAFINNELSSIGLPPLDCPFVDTLSMARGMYKGASNSLDALCRRFGIDLASRQYHGAMIDCALLATVYFELIGGRQPLFNIPAIIAPEAELTPSRPPRSPRPHQPSELELAAHAVMLERIRKPLWTGHDPREAIDLSDEI